MNKFFIRHFLLILLVIISAGVFSFGVTHGGTRGVAGRGADWAHHLSLIELFWRDGNRELARATGSLGEMAVYPPLSHWICAVASHIFHLPPPQTIQILSTFFACLGCILLGVRYVRLIEKQELHSRPRLILYSIVSVLLIGTALVGLGIFGHVQFNFFYPQLVATVFAMWGIELVKRCGKSGTLLTIIFIQMLGIFITCTHLLAGLWFYLAAWIATMPIKHGGKKLLAYTIGFGSVSLTAVWFNPYTRVMMQISGNDGAFGIWGGVVKSSPVLLLLYAAAVAISVLLLVSYFKRWISNSAHFFADHSGFLSVVVLISVNSLLFFVFKRSSWYSLKKYLLIFSFEIPVVFITLYVLLFRAIRLFQTSSFVKPTLMRLKSGGLILLLIVLQIPWGCWVHDEAKLVTYRKNLLKLHSVSPNGERTYPQFNDLLCEENYYLAISMLAIPRDSRTMQWLAQGCTGEKPLQTPF